MIDDIDVSGCKNHYKVGNKVHCKINEDWNDYCSDNFDCYYKQLKRKEKEVIDLCDGNIKGLFDIEEIKEDE